MLQLLPVVVARWNHRGCHVEIFMLSGRFEKDVLLFATALEPHQKRNEFGLVLNLTKRLIFTIQTKPGINQFRIQDPN